MPDSAIVHQCLVGAGDPPAEADRAAPPPPPRPPRSPAPPEPAADAAQAERCPAITTAVTKHGLEHDHQEAEPGLGRRSRSATKVTLPSDRGEDAGDERPPSSRPAPGSGSRVGTSAASASTGEHDAQPPGRAQLADPAGEQVEGVDRRGREPADVEDQRRARAVAAAAGSHHGASSTGTTPTRDRRRSPHRAVRDGARQDARSAATSTIRPRVRPKSQATGVNAATRVSSSPVRQAARQRRSGSGSAKPSAAWASQGSSAPATHRSEPSVPPGAGRDRHQGVRRGAPAAAASATHPAG